MTPGQRVRLEEMANGAPWTGVPTVEDIRVLLDAVTRLESVLDELMLSAAEAACARLVEPRRES